MIHFLTGHWSWALLVTLTWGAAGLILRHEVRNAPLVDATGRPIDADDEDTREHRTGHRDHEQPGGVL